MIYLLLKSYVSQSHLANLIHYISFRTIISILFSFFIATIFGGRVIALLKEWKNEGQPIRDYIPDAHRAKVGTPTMGGLIIIASVLLSSSLFADMQNPYVNIVIIIMVSFGLIGFTDDYLKISKKDHTGLTSRQKILAQMAVSLPACLAIFYIADPSYADVLTIPFAKKLHLHLGHLYIPCAIFIIIGSSNSVNLTDGLDGLAIVPICMVTACFALIAYLAGSGFYSNYLQLIHVPQVAELAVVCGSIIGAGMGFLWFNAQPAEVFMGDTGSLSLGAVLGAMSIITKHEIVLAIAGGLFVIETVSVIIQVYYFRTTGGKRFFRMAPIHHHFEKTGWSESKVVIRFWIISLLFGIIAISSLKLR
ncbi:MAG: phospho-N-acetylmuramoyl-pentapeptide-transferase [Alphaproteobacteria bacterium]|nr:phospho-N-acetylmuramoyl-pentapeptide-transferase [Alphaproteobacteria bacterium]